ncbi:MAG TPA: agmatine deiminase family protein, partial [Bacteroidia bacterium]|nr:agmatine deiminase family protein [Bacteroidia bacterium]
MFDSKNLPARAAFKWNNFGVPVNLTRGLSKQDSIVMGQFAAELTSKMKLQTLTSKLVIENGMLEINSKGVALCFMETILQRNPSFDLPEIAAELKRVLGLKKIIWLGSSPTMDKIYAGPKSANIFGYGANGHIDQFIRFANDSTILISQIDAVERKYDPVSSADYLILQENQEYLKKVTDDQDHPFNIIEIPVPAMRFHMVEDTIHDTMSDSILFRGFENGTSIYNAPMVSYLNFFICNNTLILPQYFKENLTESERA